MHAYDLDLYVRWDHPDPAGEEFLDAYTDLLFELFEGDIAPAVTAGHPCIGGTIEAASLGDAVRRLVDAVEALGLIPVRIEIHGGPAGAPTDMEAVEASA